MKYPAKIVVEEQTYLVQFLDLEEAFTEGKSLEEAVSMAEEVLDLVIQARLDLGQAVPQPSEVSGKKTYWIPLPASTQAALAVIWASSETTKAELARRMGTSWASVQRLENPKNNTTIRQLEKALAATGKRLILKIE